MVAKDQLIHLDDLCEEFDILLIDTSALVRPLEEIVKKDKLRDRINTKKTEENSSIFFNKFMKGKGVFYITREVLKESYSKGNPPISEIFPRSKRSNLSKKEQEYYSSVCSFRKERNNLLRSFRKDKKLILLNNSEKRKYDEFFNRNLFLKDRNRLSIVDYDLLITGAVLSITRGDTVILSNDFPLLYSYRSLVNKESFDQGKYGFFIRRKQYFFSRVRDNFNS